MANEIVVIADDIEARQALSHNALLGGAYRHSDGLIPPRLCEAFCETAPELNTAPFSQGSDIA